MKKLLFVMILLSLCSLLFAENIGMVYSSFCSSYYIGKHKAEIEAAGFEKLLIENKDLNNTDLSNIKMLICTRFYNEANTVDFSKTKLVDYVKNGGVLVVTDANTDKGANWIKSAFGLTFDSKVPTAYFGENADYLAFDSYLLKNIDNLYLNEYRSSKVSKDWIVLSSDIDKHPSVVCKKIGKGLLVVANIGYKQAFPNKDFINNSLILVRDNIPLEKTTLTANPLAKKREIVRDTTFKVLYPNYRDIVQSMDPNKVINIKFNITDKKDTKIKYIISNGNSTIAEGVSNDLEKFTYDISKFAPGKYSYEIQILKDNKTIKNLKKEFEVLEAAPFEVTFDYKRICYLNGKPFLPIGIYHCGEVIVNGLNSTRKEGVPELTFDGVNKDIADHGFNTAITFSSVPMNDDHVKNILGNKLIFNLEVGTILDENILKAQVDKNNQYKTGLFYYTIDEPVNQKLDNAIKMYSMLRKLDPHRPIGAAIDIPSVFYKAQDAFDIMMPDPYLYEYGISAPNLDDMAISVDAAMEACNYEKPMWAVPQAFGFGYGVERFNIPDVRGVRAQMYYFLVKGATGFCWYSYESGENSPTLPYNKWCISGTDLWDQLKILNKEANEFFPVMVNGNSIGALKGNNDKVKSNVWEWNGKKYAILVNPENKTYEVTYKIENVKPYFNEYKYNMKEANGKTTFTLEPYESVIVFY